jgi:hypothetical protein
MKQPGDAERIDCKDVDESDALIMVRRRGNQWILAVSSQENGDVEVILSRNQAERLAKALS